jgi:hypothetical protein
MIGTLSKLGFGEFKTLEVLERKYEKKYNRKKSLKWLGVKNEQRKALDQFGKNPVKKLKVDGEDCAQVLGEEKVAPEEPPEAQEYYLSFAMGHERQGKWHTGYLTYCTKFF